MRWFDRHPAAIFVLLGLSIFGMYLVKLTRSPDFIVDEVLYSQLGQHIDNFGAISLSGNPFLVHPPLDFIINAAWLRLTQNTHSPILTAVMSVRVLSALFCAICAVVTGITARELIDRSLVRTRLLAGIVATLLVATNGFVLSFGRTVLIEPAAIAAGSVIVLVGYRMRNRPAVQQIVVVGILIGLGTLVKQTVLFAALTPLLTSVLMRSRRRAAISAAAVAVGGLIWFAFPVWAGVNGHWTVFWSQQTVSVRRLIGLVHTTGVSLPHGSPFGQFLRTFLVYSSGYASLLVGAVALVVIVLRGGLLRRSPGALSEADALPVAFGILSYGFLFYSFGLGAGNQQLVIYSAPASALLCAMLFLGPRGRSILPRRAQPAHEALDPADTDLVDTAAPAGRVGRAKSPHTVSVAVLGVLLVLGAAVWGGYYVAQSDDGTANVSNYVAANIAACVPINSTGAGLRWQAALPANPVTIIANGPSALGRDVHLFLLSPKDVRYQYGNMSKSLSEWITSNGRLLYETPSRSSESLQLWQVGAITAPTDTAKCVRGYPGPSTSASAGEFLAILGGVLVVVLGLGAGAMVFARRRHPIAIDAGSHVDH